MGEESKRPNQQGEEYLVPVERYMAAAVRLGARVSNGTCRGGASYSRLGPMG
jgi:hypothetical protein